MSETANATSKIWSKGTCQSGELYDKIIDLFEEAGWEHVSSHHLTSFDVLHSKGEDGDKDLFIQLRPWWTSNAPANDVRGNVRRRAGLRLLMDYQDGAVTRANAPWHEFWLAGAANDNMPVTGKVEYSYVVDKDKLIIAIRYVDTVPTNTVLHYLGVPGEVFGDESGSRGLLWGSSSWHAVINEAGAGANSPVNALTLLDNVAGKPGALPLHGQVYSWLPPISPNIGLGNGTHMLVSCLYGRAATGVRGRLTDVYFLRSENINDRDIIEVNGTKYEVGMASAAGGNPRNTSFPSMAFAYRIE